MNYLQRLDVCRACSDRTGDLCSANNQSCQANARQVSCPAGKFSDADADQPSVVVIVTNHNYTRFLPECLSSIAAQTVTPSGVVIVNDACESSEWQGAQLCMLAIAQPLKIFCSTNTEFGDVQLARSHGLSMTQSDLVLFVDADNALDPRFIEESLRALRKAPPNVAGVYPKIRRMDDSGELSIPFDRELFSKANMIDACCLVWRHALDASWVTRGVGHEVLEDWHMWGQLVNAGWSFQLCDRAVLNYRVHSNQMSQREHSRRHATMKRPAVTLFLPLSGRRSAIEVWRRASLSLKHAQSHVPFEARVIICNTSPDPDFRKLCERSLPSIAERWDVRLYHQDLQLPPGLADLDRLEHERNVQLAICRIYNKLATELDTDLAWIVEDDIAVPHNALHLLLDHLDESTAAVSGCYGSRLKIMGEPLPAGAPAEAVVAWYAGTKRGEVKLLSPQELAETDSPTLPVMGAGFGCLLIRREALRLAPLAVTREEPWPDPRMFRLIRDRGWNVKLVTGVRCKHLCKDREPVEV